MTSPTHDSSQVMHFTLKYDVPFNKVITHGNEHYRVFLVLYGVIFLFSINIVVESGLDV